LGEKIIDYLFVLNRTPPPQLVAADPVRIRLFPDDSDEEINDKHIYL